MRILSAALVAGLGLLLSSAASAEAGWTLVWSDEFDGNKIDRDKWGYDADCWGGGNDEHQCYTKSARNAAIENGKLVITARKEQVVGPALPEHLRRRMHRPSVA
jgi:beta-glucanase (GH16 family)